jgi:hypothetical protein
MASMLVTNGCHPRQKTSTLLTFVDQRSSLRMFQKKHSQPSNVHPTPKCGLLSIFFLSFLVSKRDIENLVTFLITHLEHLFHFEHIDLQGWPHNGHWYPGNVHLGFCLRMNFVFFENLHYLEFVLHLDLEHAFVSRWY